MTATLTLIRGRDAVPVLLTSADIMREARITRRLLRFWVKAGYLKPDRLCWSRSELEVARKMGRLTRAGIPASLAASVARSGKQRHEVADGIVIEVTA